VEEFLPKAATRGKGYRILSRTLSSLSHPHLISTAPATLSERVYSAFKLDIIHGIFQPGEALSEKDLARRYKASRTPVREAAVRLQNDRLLRIVPNRGYFVAQITLQVLNDIYEFRSAVECGAAELAAAKGATSEALKELTDLAKASCSPDNRASCARFIEADTAFHVGVALLARNQMLVKAVSEARSQMERIMLAPLAPLFGEPGPSILRFSPRSAGILSERANCTTTLCNRRKVMGVASAARSAGRTFSFTRRGSDNTIPDFHSTL
jgi:DNA-binding GntR family transcriptional regulator